MVMRLSHREQQEIAEALASAQRQTIAEIGVHILPHSHGYTGYLLLDSFLISGCITAIVWYSRALPYPAALIAIALMLMLVLLMAPWCRMALLKLLPRPILHRHAAKQAGLEYLELLQRMPADKPVVLLFISLAERYVHILHSRSIHRDIDGQVWKQIVQDFTADTPRQGIKASCLAAIGSITAKLTAHYPR